MVKLVRFLIVGFLLSLAVAGPSYSVDYLGTIGEAVSKIELGMYDDAALSVERALAFDDSDPLGHITLGVVYLHTGNLEQADREFEKVLSARPSDWRFYYARGIIDLLQKRNEEAQKYFEYAKKFPASESEISALDLYLGYVKSGDKTPNIPSAQSLLIAKQTAAMAALKNGKRETASALFSEILLSSAPPGFQENRAPIVTFDTKRPVALPKAKLTWKPAERKDAAVISGVVTMNADVSRAGNVKFVSVYVDDVFAGATNYMPFEIELNTKNYSNGLHQIRIEGMDEAGNIASKKSVWVKVSNADPRGKEPLGGTVVSELINRLWNCIRVSESRKIAYYQMAKMSLEAGDNDNAIKQLEYVAAYDADYADTRKLLKRLRGGQSGYVELSQGLADSKMVALTFDDGPNERTSETLEMLARLKVPATFFLVGFRAEEEPELVKAIQAAGHEIQSHTYTHPNLTTLSVDEVESELSKATAVIRAITGKPSLYFRPPGGHANEATKQAAARQGLTCVFWTVGCSPYEGAKYSELADYVINNTTDGAIILMHNGEPASTSALPTIVEALRSRGYRFVTISEMALSAKGKSSSETASPNVH